MTGIVLLLVLFASAQDAPETAEEPLTLEVEVTEFTSKPLRLTISVDQRVRLSVTNTGTVTHTFSVPDLRIGTDALQPGETQVIDFVPRTAGEFLFTCGVTGHDEVGIPGRLVVEDPATQNVLRRSM